MNNLLFELTDGNGIHWAAKRLGGDIWLIRRSGNSWIDNSEQWITVKKLTEQELEVYQKMAGCYPRA